MVEWVADNYQDRNIVVSEENKIALVFWPVNENITNPDMFYVAFSHCNKDETKFRPNVGAWLAYVNGVHNMQVTIMRKEMLEDIIFKYVFMEW